MIIDHQLLLRAGMTRHLAPGLYTWLPMDLRVLRKVKTIVREEMSAADALGVLMSAVQSVELWWKSGRQEQYGPELLRLKDRHECEFCVGLTHEKAITDLTRDELNGYKQLPINFYQTQTKFHDEIRPRFGLIHGREFITKDAYSFHPSQHSLQQIYDGMYQAYSKIFSRLDLDFRPVQADNGSIGGNDFHELHVLANSDEDDVAFSDSSNYVVNIRKAEAVPRESAHGSIIEDMHLVDAPNTKTITVLADSSQLPIEKTTRTPAVHGAGGGTLVALIIRDDHELNETKAVNQPLVASPLVSVSEAEIRAVIDADPGSLGSANLPIICTVDRPITLVSDFAAGANIEGKRYFGVNWERDLPLPEVADLHNVVKGDPSPSGEGALVIKHGIEVGHTSQPGIKYSEAMKLNVLSEQGELASLIMGCYSIGVSHVVTAAIEQNHDERGIFWSNVLAPLQIALVPLKYEAESIKQATDKLYIKLIAAGFEVLPDDCDRKISPGAKFVDMELTGIPHRIVISDRGLSEGILEYKGRRDSESQNLPIGEPMSFITEKLSR